MRKTAMYLHSLGLAIGMFLAMNVSAEQPSKVAEAAQNTMKRATTFMTQTVSYEGGYVWSYLADFSRRWGEMEAKPTMVWVQPPGTATMGHLYLDAYHVTQDEYYYQAAQQVASALIRGQHPSGGWNYMFDLAGEESLKEWYSTIGRNGWRLEEFHHYYGNATFDDSGTFEASVFLLRLYLEKRQPQYKVPLYKAIHFVLDSQYEIGGWPQRYPPAEAVSVKGQPDYARDITFNDDVAENNIRFLLYCLQSIQDASLAPKLTKAIHKSMDAFNQLKLPLPQPGWALQYTLDLKPASARSYEPPSVSVNATTNNIGLLLNFYRLTGNKKYLDGIPQTLDWLDSLALPANLAKGSRTHPRMVELGSGKTLFLHRRGSNVSNGEYYIDYEPGYQVAHYPSVGHVNVARLREKYQAVLTKPLPTQIDKSGFILANLPKLPKYYVLSDRHYKVDNVTDQTALSVIQGLNRQGYWPSELPRITHPYIGQAPSEQAQGDYRTTFVGDKYDTSPYESPTSIEGITLKAYLTNMAILLRYLEQ